MAEKTSLSRIVGDALAAYLEIRRHVEGDPLFELIVRGKSEGRFPTRMELIGVEQEEELLPQRPADVLHEQEEM